jgi:hypothetical protein
MTDEELACLTVPEALDLIRRLLEVIELREMEAAE